MTDPSASADPSAVPGLLRSIPLVAVGSVGYVLFAPAAVPDSLLARFGIRYTAFGLLTSAPLLSVVVAQLPGGYLTARRSTTRILLAATAAHVVLAVALDAARSFRVLLALRTVWGLAAGVILTVGATHVARLYRGARETYHQGLYGGTLTLGGAVAFVAAPSLLSDVGAGRLHGPGALIGVIAVAACWRYRDEVVTAPSAADGDGDGDAGTATAGSESGDGSGSGGGDRSGSGGVRRVVTNPVVVIAAVCYIASLGSYVTLSTFITAYFVTLGIGGPLNAAVLAVASAGRAAGGAVAGRWAVDDWTSIAAATAAAVAGFGLLAVGRSPAIAVVLPLAAMLAVSFPFGAIYGVAADATVREGAALAAVIAAGNVGALALPVVVGAIRDATGGYGGGFALLGALNAVAALCVVGFRRRSRTRR